MAGSITRFDRAELAVPTSAVAGRPLVWTVDDSAEDIERVRAALEASCTLRQFNDGSAVLEALATQQAPDLIVLDWLMPGVSGIDVLRFIRSNPARWGELPVLLLTVNTQPEQVALGLREGANDFVPKPFTPEELRARVNGLIRTSTLLARAMGAESAVRMLLEQAPDPLLAVDAEGNIVYANHEAERVLSAPLSALSGRPIQEVIPDIPEQNVAVAPGVSLLPIGDVRINKRIYAPAIRVLPTHNAAHTTIALRDVTDQRVAEERRLDFYAMIAHDLRSPLNAMMLRTQMLLTGRRGPVGPDVMSELRRFETSIKTIVEMINEFLELAKLEGAARKIVRSPVDLGKLISATIEDLSVLAEVKGLRLAWHAPEEIMVIKGDAHRLGQVVANLIGNALKYTPAGGEITVSACRIDTMVEVAIADNGPGVPAESVSKIFDRYSRGPSPLPGTLGSGLGLMIVREVVEAHGGAVGVHSEEGRGSTFWFRLPA